MSEFGRRPELYGSGGLDTLADTWFGVPAADLLPGSPTPSSRKPHSQLAIKT